MCFPCPLCDQQSFATIDSLRSNLIKASNGPLSCPICHETLRGLDKLTIHLFSHSDNSGQGQTLPPPPRLMPHALQQATTKCDVCEVSFRSAELMQTHYQLIHQNTVVTETAVLPYRCHMCAKAFKMKGSLRVHLKVVHLFGLPFENNVPKLNICNKIRDRPNTPTTTDISELAAQVQVATASAALPEIIVQPAVQSSSSPVTPTPTTKDTTKNPESAKIWECDVCSKLFTTKYFLKKHKRLHSGEMPYSCEMCGKTFTFQQSYHKHLLYHSDEKPHVCQSCGRAFKELSTLHNHERIHTGEKPFKCEICDKCFRQRVSYLVHKRIHTGLMPYKCTTCDKNFRYKVSLRTHKCANSPSPLPTLPQDSTDEAIQNFFHSTTISVPTTSTTSLQSKLVEEEMLTKSLDDFVAESCHKMGIDADMSVRTPSPSDKFQHLSINGYAEHLETINEEALKLLLYGGQSSLM